MDSKQVGGYRVQTENGLDNRSVVDVPREIYDLLPEDPELHPPGQLELVFEDEVRFGFVGWDYRVISRLKELAPKAKND
ncbi:hypothetical protein K8R33_04010 [archaeon]|nr:hypothetical protein [archaeon]